MVRYRRQYIHTCERNRPTYETNISEWITHVLLHTHITDTHLSTLQPHILQLIINLPIPPNTSEEASETGSTGSHSSHAHNKQLWTGHVSRHYYLLLFIITSCSYEYTILHPFLKNACKVTPVPMYSVMGVFQPEVHYFVQLCADPLSTLLQLQHCSFEGKTKRRRKKRKSVCGERRSLVNLA